MRLLIRSMALVCLCWTITAATVAYAFTDGIEAVCDDWEDTLTDPDDFDCFGSPYSWYGEYDVSRYGEEALNYAAWICDDIRDGCEDTCTSSAYYGYLSNTVAPHPQCGQYPSWCFEGYANVSCPMTESASWSCGCGFFNFCICS